MPGVTLHYWGGVKSRSFYGNVFLAATNHLNDIELATDYPYPGTPEFAALQNLEQKSAWGQLPFLVDKDTNVKMGESMAIIRYLSKKFGEDPADLVDYALYQQSIDWVGGVHNTLSGANYAPDKAAAFKALFEGKFPSPLPVLRQHLLAMDRGLVRLPLQGIMLLRLCWTSLRVSELALSQSTRNLRHFTPKCLQWMLFKNTSKQFLTRTLRGNERKCTQRMFTFYKLNSK